MKYTIVKTNYRYPNIKPEHYRLGAVTNKTVLRADGDWRSYLPKNEDQFKNGVDSSACYIEGQQHTIATIEEESFGEVDNNYSARFNALLSDGSETGGDPLAGADSIRNDGLVPEELMPFDDNIQSWQDFHSWKGVNETALRLHGSEYKGRKKLSNEIVFEMHEPLATKITKLRQALLYSPCPISVYGWVEDNEGYIKPVGKRDNHLVEAVYVDKEGRITIRDTYAPYEKVLAVGFNPEFCMAWHAELRAVPLETQNVLIDLYKRLVVLLQKIVLKLNDVRGNS